MIRGIPRDPAIIDLFKKLAGLDPITSPLVKEALQSSLTLRNCLACIERFAGPLRRQASKCLTLPDLVRMVI